MKNLILVSSAIIVFIVIPCLLLYHYGSTTYLNNFFNNQMIPLMGTIMALNFAIATSLHTILLNIEEMTNNTSFNKTRNEIKEGLIFMIILFIIAFILQVLDFQGRKLILYPLISIKLLLFFLYFYVMYDFNKALFLISKK